MYLVCVLQLVTCLILEVKRLIPLGESAFQDESRQRHYAYWVLWTELLKRTFCVEIERCPECASTMQRIACI